MMFSTDTQTEDNGGHEAQFLSCDYCGWEEFAGLVVEEDGTAISCDVKRLDQVHSSLSNFELSPYLP